MSRLMNFVVSRRETLFGGPGGWNDVKTVAVDDTIRGGKSVSHFDTSPDFKTALFSGHLVTEILGAGFASRNLFPRDKAFPIDLSQYEGLVVTCVPDNKIYSINLKDRVAPTRPDGRLESVIEFKAFLQLAPGEKADGQPRKYFLPFSSFVPYYRGRPVTDHKEQLDLANIRMINVMCASLFQRQTGSFDLRLIEIAAVKQGLFGLLFGKL